MCVVRIRNLVGQSSNWQSLLHTPSFVVLVIDGVHAEITLKDNILFFTFKFKNKSVTFELFNNHKKINPMGHVPSQYTPLTQRANNSTVSSEVDSLLVRHCSEFTLSCSFEQSAIAGPSSEEIQFALTNNSTDPLSSTC